MQEEPGPQHGTPLNGPPAVSFTALGRPVPRTNRRGEQKAWPTLARHSSPPHHQVRHALDPPTPFRSSSAAAGCGNKSVSASSRLAAFETGA